MYYESGMWYSIPEIFYIDVDMVVEQIKAKGHNLSDYFNYGMTPDQWKIFSRKITDNWETYQFHE